MAYIGSPVVGDMLSRGRGKGKVKTVKLSSLRRPLVRMGGDEKGGDKRADKIRNIAEFIQGVDQAVGFFRGRNDIFGQPRIPRPRSGSFVFTDEPGGPVEPMKALKDREEDGEEKRFYDAFDDSVFTDNFEIHNEKLHPALRRPIDFSMRGRREKMDYIKDLVKQYKGE